MKKNRPPENPTDRLRDELDRRGWQQNTFAAIIVRPQQLVSEVINGKKEITRETAIAFAAALETPAIEWRQLQDAYRLWQLEQEPAVQSEVAVIGYRAKNVTQAPRPVRPVYDVKWDEQSRKHIATVDLYPELSARASGAEYAVKKLRALMAAAGKADAS